MYTVQGLNRALIGATNRIDGWVAAVGWINPETVMTTKKVTLNTLLLIWPKYPINSSEGVGFE